MNAGEFILYRAEDRAVTVPLRVMGGTLWLSQADMASLFGTTPQNITLHIKAIYEEGELRQESTCTEDSQFRREGRREIRRTIRIYNLDIIVAVSRRVRARRGSQFRQWVATHLGESLVAGCAVDTAPCKGPAMQIKTPFAATVQSARILRATADATMPHMELTSPASISSPSEG